jgi:hypothetical protein
MVCLCIHHWKSENTAAVESTRLSNEIKEQCEKHEKFAGGFFYFHSPSKKKSKDDEG